jgi:Phospholipase_D-nuclease N-terminal
MGLLFYIVFYAVGIWVIVDIARTPRERIRMLTKPIWIAVALLLYPIGAVLWLLFGRPRASLRRRGTAARREHPAYGGRFDVIGPQRPASPSPLRANVRADEPTVPRGPDDDPEFLNELAERLRRQNPDDPASRA